MEQQAISPIFLHQCILGTAGLGGVWGKVDPEESVQTILEALAHGVTALDTAPAYGDAELFIGEAIKQWKGPIPQISTKVGRLKSYATDECYYDYSAEGMEKSVVNSLKILSVPVIDILFLHEPSAIPPDEAEGIIKNILTFKHKGYTKRIGLGGNSPDWFRKYITADIFDVVMEFNRLDASCLDAMDTSLPDCESKGIDFYVASPLHMGLLGSCFDSFVDSPPMWLPANDINRAKRIKEIADRYNMPLPSLAHRFLLSLRHNFKIVIGAVNITQLRNTLGDFEAGPLSRDIYEEVIDTIKEQMNDASNR